MLVETADVVTLSAGRGGRDFHKHNVQPVTDSNVQEPTDNLKTMGIRQTDTMGCCLAVQKEEFAAFMSFADKMIDLIPIAEGGVHLRSFCPPHYPDQSTPD